MKNLVFVLLLAVGCSRGTESSLMSVDSKSLVYGHELDGVPVGIWKYFDADSGVILKIDFQVDLVDTIKIEQLRKYFSRSGQLISIDGVVDNQTFNFYDLHGSMLRDEQVGEFLVNEYCGSCHKMFSKFVAAQFHGMTMSEPGLNQIFRDQNHVVKDIWEDKSDFSFLSAQQIQCIVTYVNTSESAVAESR